ncbi:MAG: DNA polymerase III subunit gamma/tau [Candidatus Dadabacteria bacterium]|nr:DNA polymerase III subunit gamma/tau [Candidatus Dadabacteria bacterium]
MAYRVLARKWRPQTFEDLIGQEFPAVTLRNSIESGKIAHALLFAGPRGTGKTSTARIVAKAINCERKDGGKFPCSTEQCSICEGISEGKSLDVQEIDAASHTGVADVREIIESVKYSPASARKKVYIIDEVHMLSQSAFNALLKIMEEPPEHAIFILATTEAHKVPPTIMSRCQRYDFKKIPVEKIKESLEKITKAEGIKIDTETLYLIARESEGSMRDSLSLLDQLTVSFEDRITHKDVISLLGIPDNESLKSILRAVFAKEPAKCVELVRNAASKGISPRRMAQDIIYMFRNLLYLKICGKDFTSDLSPDEKDELSELVKDESTETVELLFNVIIDGGERIRSSFYPEIVLELALVKMSTVGKVEKIDNILKRLERLSPQASGTGKTPSSPGGQTRTAERRPEKQEDKPAEKESRHVEEKGTGENEKPAKQTPASAAGEQTSGDDPVKQEIVDFVHGKDKFLAKKLAQAHLLEVKGNRVSVKFLKNGINHEKELKKSRELRKILKEMLGVERIRLDIDTINDEEINGTGGASRKPDPAEDEIVNYAIRQFDASVIKRKNLS